MKIGPFILLPASLAVENQPLSEWEKGASQLIGLQKHVPWWLGDMVIFGEAKWGDDFWQAVPLDASISMLERFASVARKYPPQDRWPDLSWTHHVIALRVKDAVARRSVLRHASREGMHSEEFRTYVGGSDA